MNDGLLPRRYAKALYKLALENGDDKEIYDQLRELNFRYTALDELKRVVMNPYIPAERKGAVLTAAAGAREGSSMDKFILMVIRNNRAYMLGKIVLAYLQLYREANNIAKVEIAMATQLPTTEVEAIIAIVKKRLGDMTLEISQTIDPSLIGGFTVKIDDYLLDASVSNELKQLRLNLLK